MKRAFDVIVAGGGLVLTAPVLIALAVTVKATSPGPTWAGFTWRPAPSLRAALKATWPGSDHAGTSFFTLRTTKLTSAPLSRPRRSPMAHRTMCLTGVVARHWASVAAKFSMITITVAPLSLSWWASSRGV